MVVQRYTIIPEDVDLLRNLLTTDEPLLEFAHLLDPSCTYTLGDIVCELRVLQILRIAINRIDGWVTLAVGTLLLQGIEATCYLLGVLRDRFLEVTPCRRYGPNKGDRACVSIVKVDEARTCVEVSHDSREVHREGIGAGQFFETVRHLTQCLCPA